MSLQSADRVQRREHLVGFALAVLLTVIPFGAVWAEAFPRQTTIAVIALSAILQIAVHMWFFLGIRFNSQARDRWMSLVFAAVLILIMVGGTLWIMFNLAGRMGH